MGSFKLSPVYLINTKSGRWGGTTSGGSDNWPNSDSLIIDGINNSTYPTPLELIGCGKLSTSDPDNTNQQVHHIRFVFIPECISLDGGSVINENQLPSGFNLTAATVIAAASSAGLDALSTVQLENAFGFLSPDLSGSIGLTFADISFVYASQPDSIGEVITSAFGIQAYLTGQNNSCFFTHGRIEGSYQIIGTGWKLTNLTHPGYPTGTFNPGDTAQIKVDPPPPGSPPDLTKVTKVSIGTIDITTFILQTPTIIQFTIPCPDGSIATPCPNDPSFFCCPNSLISSYTAAINITSTEFSGSIALGSLSILIANASGIYTISTNSRHDTVYIDSSGATNDTGDVAIPDPYFKTGFIGG